MTTPTGAPPAGLAPGGGGTAWHALTADSVLQAEQVDGRVGLSSAEAQARAQRLGPNKFDSGKAESRWHAFLRQYADPMQIVLLVAGVGSLYPLKELGTGILLLVLGPDLQHRDDRLGADPDPGDRARAAAAPAGDHQPRRPAMARLHLRRIGDRRRLRNPQSHPAAGRWVCRGRARITHGRVTTFRYRADSMRKPF